MYGSLPILTFLIVGPKTLVLFKYIAYFSVSLQNGRVADRVADYFHVHLHLPFYDELAFGD